MVMEYIINFNLLLTALCQMIWLALQNDTKGHNFCLNLLQELTCGVQKKHQVKSELIAMQ
jgi:hypothetical protein